MDFLKDIKKTSDLLMNSDKEKFQEIELDKISIDESQPRKLFNDIEDLSNSIKQHGVLSPITVIKNEDKYIICYGERRYRAAKHAGLTTIPAIVIDSIPDDIREKQLIENIQRSELTFTEIADTIQYLIDVKKMKKKNIAESLSKSNSYVTLYYNYAKIDNDIKEMLTSKTKDITLIVEINKFLNNAEPDIYAVALDYIKSLDVIGRNIIDKLNNLSKSDYEANESVISNEDLARPNIEDYLDEPENTIINERVQKLQTDEKNDNDITEHDSNEDEAEIIENIDTPIKQTSNKQNITENRQIWYKDIYIDTSGRIFDSNNDTTLVMLSYKFYDYLFENNKLLDMLEYVYNLRVKDEK